MKKRILILICGISFILSIFPPLSIAISPEYIPMVEYPDGSILTNPTEWIGGTYYQSIQRNDGDMLRISPTAAPLACGIVVYFTLRHGRTLEDIDYFGFEWWCTDPNSYINVYPLKNKYTWDWSKFIYIQGQVEIPILPSDPDLKGEDLVFLGFTIDNDAIFSFDYMYILYDDF